MKKGHSTSQTVDQGGGGSDFNVWNESEEGSDIDYTCSILVSQNAQEKSLDDATHHSIHKLQRRRRRRSMGVSWGVARVCHITALSEFSPGQIQETWWQPFEYAQMFNENAKLLDEWMKYGRLLESSDTTFRGLEQMTHEEVQRRKRLRDEAVDAVLDEQDQQYEEENLGVPNPERVAKVYAPISLRAFRIAHRRGLLDEEDRQRDDTSTDHHILRQRRVHFCPMVHVQPVLHLHNYSPSEIKRCWFSEVEVKRFKAHSKEVINALLQSMDTVPVQEMNPESKLEVEGGGGAGFGVGVVVVPDEIQKITKKSGVEFVFVVWNRTCYVVRSARDSKMSVWYGMLSLVNKIGKIRSVPTYHPISPKFLVIPPSPVFRCHKNLPNRMNPMFENIW